MIVGLVNRYLNEFDSDFIRSCSVDAIFSLSTHIYQLIRPHQHTIHDAIFNLISRCLLIQNDAIRTFSVEVKISTFCCFIKFGFDLMQKLSLESRYNLFFWTQDHMWFVRQFSLKETFASTQFTALNVLAFECVTLCCIILLYRIINFHYVLNCTARCGGTVDQSLYDVCNLFCA
jgi:hypothetical protein